MQHCKRARWGVSSPNYWWIWYITSFRWGCDFCHHNPNSVQVDRAGGTQWAQNSRWVVSIPSPVPEEPFCCHKPKPVARAVICLCCHLAPAWLWNVPEDKLLSPEWLCALFWAESWPGTSWGDMIWVLTICCWSPPSLRLLFVPSLQCPVRDRKIHWGKLKAAVDGCCSPHSWGYLEDDRESPKLCEMCWWFLSLLQ